MLQWVALPPANKVWNKGMFFTPVCHSVHWGDVYPNNMQLGRELCDQGGSV